MKKTLMISALLTVMILTGCTANDKFTKALENGQYINALTIYEEEVYGERKKEKE